MTPFEAYKEYLALRNHFNSPGYDYFKYNGKVSGSVDSFNKRKDRFFFEKLAKHRDPRGLLVANFVKNPKAWIKEIAYAEDAERNYLDWVKRQQSLSYVVKNDLGSLDDQFDENFKVHNNEHPTLIRRYSAGCITEETLCILADLTGCTRHWKDKLDGDPVWGEIELLIKKYTPFIKYDKEKVKKVVVDTFSER